MSSRPSCNPDPHDRHVYPLFGAEELDWHEIAAKVQATLGIPVRYEPIDIRPLPRARRASASADFVQHISNVAQDYRDGIFAGVNNLVEVIGGVKPITVEDYVAATRPQFEPAGRLVGEREELATAVRVEHRAQRHQRVPARAVVDVHAPAFRLDEPRTSQLRQMMADG